MALSVLDEAPAELAKEIALKDGELIISDARKGDPVLLSFVSLAKRRGVDRWRYVPAEKFLREYGDYLQIDVAVSDSDIQKYAIKLFQEAVKRKATDIHIIDYGTYGLIQFRCLGMLQDYTKLPGQYISSLISVLYSTLCSSRSNPSFTKGLRLDARISRREFLPKNIHSVRIHTEPIEAAEAEDSQGTFMALRLLADQTTAQGSLESRLISLGYRNYDVNCFRELVGRTGLIIIAGPVNSGKSTTLKHVIESCTQEFPQNSYMSIEDPPEYPMANVKQVPVYTGTESDVEAKIREQNYVNAITGALRSDTNTVIVGEIRYAQAAFAAIDLAQTNHAVWSTLHATNCFGIIKRLRSMLDMLGVSSPMEYLCDYSLVAGLIYQRLVPLLCDHCKLPFRPNGTAKERKYLDSVLPPHVRQRLLDVVKKPESLENICIRGEGCAHCKEMGIVGQSVVAEVVVTDEKLLQLVYENNDDNAHDYWINVMHGQTFVDHALEGISKGILDPYLTELRLGVPLNYTRNHADR
jgi:type II secretory ATPase GspE/PulE/Tfp pilus assembly ATPase PilB-like protein